jgi:hypothetical protein
MSDSNNKIFLIAFISMLLFGGYLLLRVNTFESNSSNNSTLGTSVSTADGKQVIEITAKGGYYPTSLVAKANRLIGL